MGALSFLKESVYADETAQLPGLMQARDPRIKVITVFLLIAVLLFVKSTVVLFGFYVLCLVAAKLSQINMSFFLKRTWFFIPLFSLFIAIPALFSFVTPGNEVAGFSLGNYRIAVTQQGIAGALLFITRVITSVSLVILVALTTKHNELLKVLRAIKIPQLFVMVIGMCYRYIYLFVEMLEQIHTAVKSRVGTNVHHKRGRHIVTWNIASLWMRSYQLNNHVYNAMISRGYRGEPKSMHEFNTSIGDWFWLAAVIVTSIGIYLLLRPIRIFGI